MLKANELVGMQRFADAERLLRDVLAGDPNNAHAHALLGVSLANMGRGREGLAETEAAIGLDAEDAYSFYAHSVSLDRCRCRSDAIDAIREALRLENTNPAYHQRLAYFHFCSREWKECIAVVDDALAISPHRVQSLTLRGKALLELDRPDEAQQAFETALASNPDNAEAHHSLGSLQLSRGENGPALDHLLEARRLDPIYKNDHESIALALGRLLPPFRVLAWLAPSWPRWRPTTATACFVTMMFVCASLQKLLPGGFGMDGLGWEGRYLAVLVLNWLLLAFTFDQFAVQAAKMLRRKRVGAPWRSLFVGLPRMAVLILAHCIASVFGTVGPISVMVVLAGAACNKFIQLVNRAQGLSLMLCIVFGSTVLFAAGQIMASLFDGTTSDALASIAAFAVLAFLSNRFAEWLQKNEPSL